MHGILTSVPHILVIEIMVLKKSSKLMATLLLQVPAQAAQYVSLPLPGGDPALSAEYGGGRLDRHRHRHIPTVYQPRHR